MPSVSKEDKTITWACVAEDEAKAKVGLQELLDANPGYTPVLIVEDAAGKETTYNSLEAPSAEDAPESPARRTRGGGPAINPSST